MKILRFQSSRIIPNLQFVRKGSKKNSNTQINLIFLQKNLCMSKICSIFAPDL